MAKYTICPALRQLSCIRYRNICYRLQDRHYYSEIPSEASWQGRYPDHSRTPATNNHGCGQNCKEIADSPRQLLNKSADRVRHRVALYATCYDAVPLRALVDQSEDKDLLYAMAGL